MQGAERQRDRHLRGRKEGPHWAGRPAGAVQVGGGGHSQGALFLRPPGPALLLAPPWLDSVVVREQGPLTCPFR